MRASGAARGLKSETDEGAVDMRLFILDIRGEFRLMERISSDEPPIMTSNVPGFTMNPCVFSS
jgi:hypothetical protein